MEIRGGELGDIVPGVVLVEELLVLLYLRAWVEQRRAVARIAVVQARPRREVDVLVGIVAVTVATQRPQRIW